MAEEMNMRIVEFLDNVVKLSPDERSSSDFHSLPSKGLKIPRRGYGPGLLALIVESRTSDVGYSFGYGHAGGYEDEDDTDSDTSIGDLFGDKDDSPDDQDRNSNRKVIPVIPTRKIEIDPKILEKGTQIDFSEQAAIYLGLVQKTCTTGVVLPCDLIDDPPWIGQYDSQVQVFSVRIKNINPGDVYGRIEVYGGIMRIPLYLYNREPNDPKSISLYDDTLSLIGPNRCIDWEEFASVSLKLKYKDGNLFPGKSKKRGVSSYYRYGECGKPVALGFSGKFCSATMYFMVIPYAARAKVTVELVEREDKDRVDRVYGTIIARYSNFFHENDKKKKYWQNVLFHYPENNYMKVSPLKLIPLSRSVMAVPVNSSLIIEAKLRDYDKLIPDNEIATGTAEFSTHCSGKVVHDINGVLRVTVLWY